ncbi:MAG: hypothetical protein JXA21_06185 [Anaerolineae bacterium]|nr:hypothetical protein [Anaerolineae bacterium]
MADLQSAVKSFATGLAERIEKFVQDMSEVEVRTYTTPSDQIKVLLNEKPDAAKLATEGNVQLRAYTQISFDGDTTVVVPTAADGTIDAGVWALHQEMVNTTVANRAAMIQKIGEAAAAALKALRSANE